MKESKKYTLNKDDVERIGMGALVALGGAGLTYASQVLTQSDFGQWTPIVVVVAGVAINAGRKYLDGRN